jgi:hypothetical protein
MGVMDKVDVAMGVGRRELLSRLSKHGSRAIDVLGAACEKGDVNAAKIILGKMLPDLKAVDISQLESSQARIVINPRIYINSSKDNKQVKLPNININITEKRDMKVVQEVDISPQLKASMPAAEAAPVNVKAERLRGSFR